MTDAGAKPARQLADPVYVVTDIEADGPTPGAYSMLSFASVAVAADGSVLGEFDAVLQKLPGAERHPATWAWFESEPEALRAATANPQPAETVMPAFARWVAGLPGNAIFTAHPLGFDGPWIDHYLHRFVGERLNDDWRAPSRLFKYPGLCLRSFAAGRLGRPIWQCDADHYPPAWLGFNAHTHRALDDARGYAHLLRLLLAHPVPSLPLAS
jgi:hypothetical protein